LKAAKALDPLRESVNLKIVLGSAFSGEKELQKGLEKLNLEYQIKKDVENMAELMWWADIAVIAGGGSSLYEIARMGTPGVVMSKVEHQMINAKRFAERGTVINLGFGNECSDEVITSAVEKLLSDYELRHEMSEKGMQLVDGQGRKRVLEIIEGVIK
jgi:spore coat polysaccharide biosynthesis predicted glycosyltransferase SpsG